MNNHFVELFSGVCGFIAVIMFKIPVGFINTDYDRLKLAAVTGLISGVVGWCVKNILDNFKRRYYEKKRKKDWEDNIYD